MESFGYRRCGSDRTGLRALVVLLVAALNLAILPESAVACECAPAGPPCAEYSATQIVFLGTVTEVIQPRLFRMRVDKAYKGVSTETVILYDSGMCDGPVLRVGEQYLMYTHDDGSGYLPSRGCTRSRNVKDAAEDLAFLNSLPGAAPTGTISGQVTVSTGNVGEMGAPLSGASVEIANQETQERASATTDNHGRYSVAGLQPGSYFVTASKLGFTSTDPEDDGTIGIEARDCAVIDLSLNKSWPGTIRGRVTRSDGTPAPVGMSVDLIRMEGKSGAKKSKLLVGSGVKTDDNGEYSFPNVAPGSYKIVLNIYKPPTAESPYPEQYWPQADKEASASTIEINESVTSQRCDFRLPSSLKSKPVKFLILLPDGTPAEEVRAQIGTQMDGMFTWVQGETITDESGRFSFNAIDGFDYTLRDIRTEGAFMAAEIHFSASDHTHPITIKLVPTEP